VYVKTLVAQEQRMPLTSRKLLQRKKEAPDSGRSAVAKSPEFCNVNCLQEDTVRTQIKARRWEDYG
jgi:hypothetical protein